MIDIGRMMTIILKKKKKKWWLFKDSENSGIKFPKFCNLKPKKIKRLMKNLLGIEN